MPHRTARSAIAPLLLSCLAANVPCLRAQEAFTTSDAAVTAYVSVSGATAFGYSASERAGDRSIDVAIPKILPRGSNVPSVARLLIENMWRRSLTFRRQCTRLVEADVVITMTFDHPLHTNAADALTEIRRAARTEAHIHLRAGSRVAEHLAHEIEHVLEQIDEVDLARAVGEGVHGVSAANRGQRFETTRAIAVGRLVAREVEARPDGN
jgi:hypothetical protein